MSDASMVKEKGIHKLIDGFTRWCIHWVPDSMVFVLVLTLIAFLIAWGLTPHGPYDLLQDWMKGFWSMLAFAMQMCVLMITGFCIADSPPVRKGIITFVTLFKTRGSAMMAFCLLSGMIYWLHWGVGMMCAIIIGREMCARNRGLGLDFRHVAAGACCANIMSAALSYAPPLWVATPGHFMENVIGIIPITETIFDSHQIVLHCIVLFLYVTVLRVMMPSKEKSVGISNELADEIVGASVKQEERTGSLTPAEKMDRSFLLVAIIAAIGIFWVCDLLYRKGFAALTLDVVNFSLLMLGLVLHRSINSYMASVIRGTTTVGGVIVQFPFYAGIFGIIQHSGLSGVIAGWFVSISTAQSFPWVTYIYSAILNFFVPSGGSKFIIELPYIAPAAKELGANMAYVVNSYGWGDLTTNLIQPFWAIPLLAAFRLKFQDILPYTLVFCMIMLVVCSIGIYFFPQWW